MSPSLRLMYTERDSLSFLQGNASLKIQHTSVLTGQYVKAQIEDGKPRSRVSESVGLGCDHGICISNKFLGVADAAGPASATMRTTSLESLS